MKNVIIYVITIVVFAYNYTQVNASEPTGYLSVTGSCNLKFPQDHGPHPGYRTEWWYYTGNLQASSGEKYGFQLTFFRSQIRPSADRQKWPQPASAWRTQQLYLAHSAISDLTAKKHLQAERVSRQALNMSGTKQVGDTTTVFLKDWSVNIGPVRHLLKVKSDGFSYELTLTPLKPQVLHGNAGYSRKGPKPGQASCYYSFTRLAAEGWVSSRKKTVAVKGLAWMDHEYGTDFIDPGFSGWDWFSLQLSDQTEVMAFVVRNKKGSGIGSTSSATLIDKQGKGRNLRHSEFVVNVRDTWKSPHSKTVYPSGWRIKIFPGGIDLIITPDLDDQEMQTYRSTGLIYWEGSVSVAGTREGKPVTGKGYVELTGYAKSFDAPL